jgi:hypothetical protein
MITEPKRIKVNPGSEIARILDEAKENPIILESNGDIFRLYYEKTEQLSGFDPEEIKQAIAQTAGSWADLDTDKMITELYQAREQGSRPMARP